MDTVYSAASITTEKPMARELKVPVHKGGRLRKRRLKIWGTDYLHYRYLWPNIESMIRKALQTVPNDAITVLDVGCGHKPYRELFGGVSYVGLDYGTLDSSPDVVGDATRLPVRSGAVDVVFSTQVIEHVRNPEQMVMECARVLRPGGSLIITGPLYWPLHEEPYDFHRFTKYAFANYLMEAGFETWNIVEDGGDWAQICLSISLHLNQRWLAPVRAVVNSLGLFLDWAFPSRLSPANYTVLARR